MRVIRSMMSLAMVVGMVLIAAPFIFSWRAIDERGVEVPGKVESKREYVRMRYSSWERVCEAMVFYNRPDSHAASSLTARVDPAHFDQLHNGGQTTVRYLRRKDVPALPGAAALHDMHILPAAKLPGEFMYEPSVLRALWWVAGGALLLFLWRVLRWPGFPWALAAGIALLVAGILNSQFPRPTIEPHDGVRTATGRVASVHRIKYLFGGNRNRGMEASQPIDVVGVEFTPAPGAEPVLVIDLIDADSIDGIKTGAPADVSYEAGTPRTARLRGGTRQFADRNLQGAIFTGAIAIGLFLGLFLVLNLIGRALKGAVQRPLRTIQERSSRAQNRF